MKNVLIIHAHPEEKSFCTALSIALKNNLESTGSQVEWIDLYKIGFNPAAHDSDFFVRKDAAYFKYQFEQTAAFQERGFSKEIQHYLDKLEWCDTLIFSFPLWWFGLPAILKGWVDRVFAMGAVYGAGKGVYENGYFKGKKAMLLMTTGGPEIAYGSTGKNGDLNTILFPIQHGMFYFTGFTVLEPIVCFAPARKSEEERKEEINDLTHLISRIATRKTIYG